MENSRKTPISIFTNLPAGGGKRVEKIITVMLSDRYDIQIYKSKHVKFKTFFSYYKYVLFNLPSIHKKIAKKINNNNSKVVIIHHDYLTKSPYLLRYIKIPSIYICHEEPREFYNDKKFFLTDIKNKVINTIRLPLKYIDQQNIKHATVAVANSTFSQQKLSKIYNRKFEKINMGVDQKVFYPIKNIKKENIYLTIGSTSKFKGIDFIIKSISLLPKEYQYPLTIVGSNGRDFSYIKKLAKNKNIQINIVNKLTDTELNLIYNKSKLLLAAAVNEPFGLSLIEAVSCGTRVVAVNEGGYKEIISNNTIGNLTERNQEKFAKCIEHNLKVKPNIDQMIKIIKENFSWENTQDKLSKIIEPLT